MTPEQRSERARNAVMARWAKERATEDAGNEKNNKNKVEFNELTRTWKTERQAVSSTTAIVMHPAYQRIIGMGKPALPLILRELNKELDHWFWALKAIAGEDPVPQEHRGKMKQMAADWLQWGREKGYVR